MASRFDKVRPGCFPLAHPSRDIPASFVCSSLNSTDTDTGPKPSERFSLDPLTLHVDVLTAFLSDLSGPLTPRGGSRTRIQEVLGGGLHLSLCQQPGSLGGTFPDMWFRPAGLHARPRALCMCPRCVGAHEITFRHSRSQPA